MAAARTIADPNDPPLLGEEADAFLPRPLVPPWLMSVVLHCIVLLTLALVIRPVVMTQGPGDEPDRNVGIALRGVAHEEPDYFETQQASDAAPGEASTALTQEQALPESNQTPVEITGVLPEGGLNIAQGDLEAALPGAGGMVEGVTPSPTPGTGEQAHTYVFGAEGVGTKFLYVFDRSGSMDGYGGRPMAAAKAALLKSLEDLAPTHQFQIIFYNEIPQEFTLAGETPRLHLGADREKTMAERFVRGIVATGGTRHMEALRLALRMHPDVIFFLTDANEPRLSAEQLDSIRRANGGLTVIHAIEFGYGPSLGDDNFLQQLARQNNGQHVYVDISQLSRQ